MTHDPDVGRMRSRVASADGTRKSATPAAIIIVGKAPVGLMFASICTNSIAIMKRFFFKGGNAEHLQFSRKKHAHFFFAPTKGFS